MSDTEDLLAQLRFAAEVEREAYKQEGATYIDPMATICGRAATTIEEAMKMLIERDDRIAQLEAAARWIPVEEGLPTKQGRYDTIWVNDRENRYRILDAGFTTHFLSRPDSTVEYWREMEPLPQPPTKGE